MNRNGTTSLVVVSPNPFVSELSAFINVNRAQSVTITLTDMNGKRLAHLNKQYAEGSTEVSLPTSQLTRGIYFLKAVGADFSVTHKVVKQ